MIKKKSITFLSSQVVKKLTEEKLYITTVESCTGGGLANAITNIPGASSVLKDSFITYSDEAKIALGVPKRTIKQFSVYSPETAVAMAQAGLKTSARADISVGITGRIIEPEKAHTGESSIIDIALVYRTKVITQQFEIKIMPRPETKEYIISAALEMIMQILT